MAVGRELPTLGTDAAGADAYAAVIAAPTAPKVYRNLVAVCATQNAILSLDAGTTDQVFVVAGAAPVRFDGLWITKAIHAKNATGGSNYANLAVMVW